MRQAEDANGEMAHIKGDLYPVVTCDRLMKCGHLCYDLAISLNVSIFYSSSYFCILLFCFEYSITYTIKSQCGIKNLVNPKATNCFPSKEMKSNN